MDDRSVFYQMDRITDIQEQVVTYRLAKIARSGQSGPAARRLMISLRRVLTLRVTAAQASVETETPTPQRLPGI